MSFDDAINTASQLGGKKHILLGNGFSIGAHQKFKYGTLYQQAVNSGLPSHIKQLFDHYGTANFEEVLRQLEQGQWLADHYSLGKSSKNLDMATDYETVKQALIDSIAANHPESRGQVSVLKLLRASRFLASFNDVYTTNYDLLLYWASLVGNNFAFEDGFGREPRTDEEFCVFLPVGSGSKHIYFLHGALHLYTWGGEVRKMVWNTTGVTLIDQIKEALDFRRYPLVVSEGSSARKVARIEASSYLSYCSRKFENIQGNLFTYGMSLSSQDRHIANWIVMNTTLQRLFVGVYGDPSYGEAFELVERSRELIRQRKQVLYSGRTARRFKKEELEVYFFDSSTASVW
ncbi:MAG: DUF4917 family protein [bacterium]|nr:DUF4917 family protein [bacterium]MDE0235317.1 DUF4917 family protein [bacterium]